jgi:hypothetical protein
MDKFSEPSKASTPSKKNSSNKKEVQKKNKNVKVTFFHLGKPESQIIGYVFSGGTYDAKEYIETTLNAPYWVSKSTCTVFHKRVRKTNKLTLEFIFTQSKLFLL